MAILTDTKAKTIAPNGKNLPDGTVKGLRLHSSGKKGRGYWQLRYTSPVTGKRRDVGFGCYPEVSIATARKFATSAHEGLAQGLDPIEVRKLAANDAEIEAEGSILTFEIAAREYISQKKDGWSSSRHIDNWSRALEIHAFPIIGHRPVESLEAEDFRRVLEPIWLDKADTARRVKQRCQKIMQWCWAQKLVQSNVLSVVVELLPDNRGKRIVEHFPALRWQQLPDFAADILNDGSNGTCRELMEFIIHTACRSGEARKATWDQINFDQQVWTIPSGNTKMRKEHQVPLSSRVLGILRYQQKRYRMIKDSDSRGSDLVFPSPRGIILSDM